MNHTDTTDTICAISTPPGVGGIAVARISGPQAIEIADRCWRGKNLGSVESHTAHLGTIIDTHDQTLDQGIATVYRAPHSFTGDDVVEFAVHGSRFVQRELIATLIAAGARMAEPGEFTRRAFTSGKMDLTEAEAVADVIASNSRAAHRIAISQMRGGFSRRLTDLRAKLLDLAALLELELDFSEEDVEFASRERITTLATDLHNEITRLHRSFSAGNAIKEGIPVAIAGATNAGKSSLLNAMLGDDRAIVSNVHGTTRDTIEETLEIGDFLFRFIDTAGIRDTSDAIEKIGIDRSYRAISDARIIIIVIDPTEEIPSQLFDNIISTTESADDPAHFILAINKSDIASDSTIKKIADRIKAEFLSNRKLDLYPCIISAKNRQGIDTLCSILEQIAETERGNADEGLLVTNARHAQALDQAAQSTSRLLQGLTTGLPGDLLAQDLRETLHHLSTITGDIPSTEILATIFSRFCIGK